MEYIDLVNIEKKVVSALNFGILKYLPRGILLSKTFPVRPNYELHHF